MAKSISASVGRQAGKNRADDVITIQQLLDQVPLDSGGPVPALKVDGICGPKTGDAIQKFQLKHFGWKLADGRVDPGGPTLEKLNEFDTPAPGSQVCVLVAPCPPDALFNPGPMKGDFQKIGFVPVVVPASPVGTTDAARMAAALKDSRTTLKLARNALTNLLTGLAKESTQPLNAFQTRVLISVGRWLKAPTAKNNAARATAKSVIKSAIKLMDANLAVRTSTGGDPVMKRVTGGFHAQVFGNPDSGVECGDPFFLVDGPRCRRDVITHEFFHFVGVHHGGGALNAPTPRSSITTSQQALDSADNLAQLVSELMNGTTDACAIAGK